jgi:Na+/proline symporter
MLAAKTEKHALGATLFFNVAHYAIRPWPWILVALASMLVYPNISDLQAAFPHIPADKLGHDLAYSAMLETVPPGWLGLIMASLIAAYMSTISTHLNWGSSYIVNDFYIRFIKPSASQREMVWVGRVSTVILTVVTVIFALFLQNAQQLFNILLQVGAGTGLLLIMRWFWWRINPISELTAMVVSFLVAVGFVVLERLNIELAGHWQLLLGVTITTTSWIVATLVTQPSDHKTLVSFIEKINPGGAGWNAVKAKAEAEGQPIQTSVRMDSLPKGILRMVLGCLGVYGFLFGTGYFIYGETTIALVSIVVAAVSTVILVQSLLKDEALDAAPGQQA